MSEQSNRDLLDRAWNDMRLQLDENMPYRKNNPWIFGTFVLLGFLLGIGTMWFIYHSSSLNNAPKEVQPLLALENVLPSNTIHKNEHRLLALEPTKDQDRKALLTNSPDVESTTHRVEYVLPVLDEIKEPRISTPVASVNTNEITTRAINSHLPDNDFSWATTSLPGINLYKIQSLRTKHTLNYTNPVSNTFDKPSDNTWYWSVVAGIFSDNAHSLNGGNFGLNLNKKLSKQWDIKFGWVFDGLVKEGFRNVLSSSNSSSLLVAGSNLQASRDFTQIERVASYDEIAQSVNGLFYMRLPMELTYWALPKLGIKSGFHVSYLIYGTNDKIVNEALTPVDTKYFYRKKVLNKTDIGISGGLSYALTHNIHLDLTYRYGLSQVLRKIQFSNRVDFNRSFNLNIEYLF